MKTIEHDERRPLSIAMGKIINKRRLAHGWSVPFMANKVSLHPSILTMIERGEVWPYSVDLDRIAVAFGHKSCAPVLMAAWLLSDMLEEARRAA